MVNSPGGLCATKNDGLTTFYFPRYRYAEAQVRQKIVKTVI